MLENVELIILSDSHLSAHHRSIFTGNRNYI